jgi:hypothetical protein
MCVIFHLAEILERQCAAAELERLEKIDGAKSHAAQKPSQRSATLRYEIRIPNRQQPSNPNRDKNDRIVPLGR